MLLRKLLNYDNGPAIIILHWWSPVTQVGVQHCSKLWLGHHGIMFVILGQAPGYALLHFDAGLLGVA